MCPDFWSLIISTHKDQTTLHYFMEIVHTNLLLINVEKTLKCILHNMGSLIRLFTALASSRGTHIKILKVHKEGPFIIVGQATSHNTVIFKIKYPFYWKNKNTYWNEIKCHFFWWWRLPLKVPTYPSAAIRGTVSYSRTLRSNRWHDPVTLQLLDVPSNHPDMAKCR